MNDDAVNDDVVNDGSLPLTNRDMARREGEDAGAAEGGSKGGRATVRLLVVDDHPVVRSGIVGMLSGEDDLLVVGQASDGQEAVSAARELRPDVVLIDLRMPVLDGVGATRQILAAVRAAALGRSSLSPSVTTRLVEVARGAGAGRGAGADAGRRGAGGRATVGRGAVVVWLAGRR